MKCECCEKTVSTDKTTINIHTHGTIIEHVICNDCGSIIERLIDHASTHLKIKDDSGE